MLPHIKPLFIAAIAIHSLTASISAQGADQPVFDFEFELIYRTPGDNPQLARAYDWQLTKSLLASWLLPSAEATTEDDTTSESLIERKPAQAERSFDISLSGESTRFTGTAGAESGPTHFTFPTTPTADLIATLEPAPADGHGARLTWTLTAKQDGWFALGYLGAPATSHAAVTELYQPLIWQERRLPQGRYLSIETMATFPGVLAETTGHTYGLIPDPDAIPFRMPTMENSLFGLALRASLENDLVQPQLYAPVMGTEHSFLHAGESRTFAIRLINRAAPLRTVTRDLTTGLYQFKNQRENAIGSFNDALDNMIRFQMDDRYSGWNADLKGFDYKEDVLGTVKVVSSLQALSTALITDNEEIYLQRALPLIEYLLSREKYLFSFTGKQAAQNATHRMGGPAMEVSELAALYNFSGRRSPIFRELAEELNTEDRVLNLKKVSPAHSFVNELSLYRATGDAQHLAAAQADADRYLEARLSEPETVVSKTIIDENSCFPTDFIPLWVDLFELYEATGEARYLEAAHFGAEAMARWCWVYPVIPDTTIGINPDGEVHESHLAARKHHPKRWPAAPQQVPAWRLSQIGLFPESSLTAMENPAVYLAHHAPYFIRIAQATGDELLYELARSAVVGRYQNYPGYDINYVFTTFNQRVDYPYHNYDDYFTYNQIYYNHVWPQIGVLYDYLLADATYRSAGEIDFPAQYAQGYAYLQSKVFGAEPGRIYGHDDLKLWMPAGLLRSDNIQINHLSARGPDAFYLVLLNESAEAQTITFTLNGDLVPFNYGRDYPVTHLADANAALPALRDGRLALTLPPHGIAPIRIEGLVVPGFFQDRFSAEAAPLGADSFATLETPFGPAHAQLLRFGAGRDLTHAYIWLESAPETSKTVTLRYRLAADADWQESTDAIYPFEFSIPVSAEASSLEWSLRFEEPNGTQTDVPGGLLK